MWGYGYWPEYVPVAQRKANAKKEAEKLRKKGIDIHPVEIPGRKIASSFWGKGWCDHMESYHDFENRLPRGRTYVRNGSVVHLEIAKGLIKALVAGSETYTVEIKVDLLPRPGWEEMLKRCAGQISSLLDLLKGKLSDGVMRIVTDKEKGLFPGPDDFRMECSCPDYASMCKHIAAVLYGVGARLDTQPELLFLLRGVDHTELATQGGVDAVIDKGRGAKSELAGSNLSELFGIELVDGGVEVPPASAPQKPSPAKSKVAAKVKTPAKIARKPQTGKTAKKPKAPAVSSPSPASHKKPKASPKPATPRKSRTATKNDKERLDKIVQLAKKYAAEKKKKEAKKPARKKGGK